MYYPTSFLHMFSRPTVSEAIISEAIVCPSCKRFSLVFKIGTYWFVRAPKLGTVAVVGVVAGAVVQVVGRHGNTLLVSPT